MSRRLAMIATLTLLPWNLVLAEEKDEPKKVTEKVTKTVEEVPEIRRVRPAVAVPAVRLLGRPNGNARVEFNEFGPVVFGKVEDSEIRLSYTKDEKVRLEVVRTYSMKDPELEKKYPHLHKQLGNLARPMGEETVTVKVESSRAYEAKDLDALTKEHPELAEKYARYTRMFRQVARLKGGVPAGGIRLEVRPAVPARVAPVPRKPGPKKVEPKKIELRKIERKKVEE